MTKRHFIELADRIRRFNHCRRPDQAPFTSDQIQALADFCASQNPEFKRDRWLDYINGNCGPNGGKAAAR